MYRNKAWTLVGLIVVLSMFLSACGPTAEPATPAIVEVTRVVEVGGETKTETVIVTATPEPMMPASADNVVKITIGMSYSQELWELLQPALKDIQERHPEWEVVFEMTPGQSGNLEKIMDDLIDDVGR